MYCSSVIEYGEAFAPKDWTYVDIVRPYSLIYYAVSGTAFYTIGGETRQFRKGHLYLFPANVTFSLSGDDADRFRHMYVHAFLYPELGRLVEVDASLDEFLSATIRLMRRYAGNRNSVYIRRLTEMLISYLSETTEAAGSATLAAALKRRIDRDYADVFVGAVSLAEEFRYSDSRLAQIFREAYNVTPKQYARGLVLKEIPDLLRKGESVKRIAERFRFSSPENFSRFFKTNYGCSPAAYRKLFLSSDSFKV